MGRRGREVRRDRSTSYDDEEKKETPSLDRMEDGDDEEAALMKQGSNDDDGNDDDDGTSSLENEDPYTYSDDSASLSDAYFFPQAGDHDLARPPRYRREQERLRRPNPLLTEALVAQPNASYATHYGSMGSSTGDGSPALSQKRPLWTGGGAIHEEKVHVMVPPITYDNSNNALLVASSAGRSKRDQRKRQQRRSQREKLKQLQAGARERRVAQVRGRPQSMKTWKNPVFAAIFLMQLWLVVGSAVYYLRSSERWMAWRRQQHHHHSRQQFTSSSHPSTRASVLEGLAASAPAALDGHRRHLTVLHLNTTTGDEQYTDDDSSAATLKMSAKQDQEPIPMTVAGLEYRSVLAVLCINGVFACILSLVSFGFMLILVRSIIPIMLIVSVLITLAWGLIGMTLDPYGFISILGFAALLLTLSYTIYNWNRIPFAATNLHTTLCALRWTADVFFLGLGSLVIALAWCLVWSIAFVGTVKVTNRHQRECDSSSHTCDHVHALGADFPICAIAYSLLIVSFCWSNSVIKNVVRATVASAMGTWWYYPQDVVSPLCTPTVGRPLKRALTKSFGSICFGSLVTPVAQFISMIGSTMCCIVGNSECIRKDDPEASSNVEVVEGDSAADSVQLGSRICSLVKRFGLSLRSCNRWSIIYIAMYGYSFPEAGERALLLFETREWLEVVNDNLIQNMLLISSVIIAACTGMFAVFVEEADGNYFPSLHMPTAWAFLVGSTLGYTLGNILLRGVVGGAVNAVLVCFAAAPFEFDKNHPQLSQEMREVWSQQVWSPDE